MVNTVLYSTDSLALEVERQKQLDWADLDPALRAFAHAYMISYNHREAAEAAGYSASKGISLVRDPLVSAYVQHLQNQNLVSNVITEDFVRSQYLNLIPKLAGEEDINIVTAIGQELSVKKFHSSELVAVLRELGKSTKFYENGSGQESGVTINLNLGDVCSDKVRVIDGEVVQVETKKD